jgi:CRISPR-associated protein Csd1
MILQALKDYYERKAIDPDSGIAPEGFELKEIPFIIVIDENGDFVQFEDTREQRGKQVGARSFRVPQSVKRSINVKANLLWDNVEYVLGAAVKGNPLQVESRHQSFIERVKELNLDDEIAIAAVLKFFQKNPAGLLELPECPSDLQEGNPFVALRLNGDTELICERSEIVRKLQSISSKADGVVCLVSGEIDILANLHPAIKGIRDAKSTGANIVSFNHQSFTSFGKLQGANAPIGNKAAFAYTTSLNYLLRKDSPQKIQIGDATTVFWSERSTALEDDFATLFDEPPKDDPDRLVTSVKALLQSIDTGAIAPSDCEARFFVLGLSPNAARASVRFWTVGTVLEQSQSISRHFRDIEICHGPRERDFLSIWAILKSLAAQGESKNIPPKSAGDWIRTILEGRAYPESLLQAALRRIRADRDVTYPRAAILKGWLNRRGRIELQAEREITVGLDIENGNIGYRLGRLFATLEKTQEEAQPDINKTIRDRYYSAASATPATVMPILLRLKNHHLGKLEKGRAIFFERTFGKIIGDIADFPAQLNLFDQGRFAIGYYHQRQAFFTKSANSLEGDKNE